MVYLTWEIGEVDGYIVSTEISILLKAWNQWIIFIVHKTDSLHFTQERERDWILRTTKKF